MLDIVMFKAMSHLQRLNTGVIRIATDPKLFPLAAPTLLDEIAHCRTEDQRAKAAYMLQDSVAMYQLLYPNRKCPEPISRMRHLAEVHDTLIEDVIRARCLDIDIPFPPPPVKGSEFIVPITTVRELIEEGRLQHNCVASYIEWIALHQRVFIYRVLWPERCTLSIIRRSNKWIMSELKRACNESPSEATRRVVADWFAQSLSGNAGHIETRELDEVPF